MSLKTTSGIGSDASCWTLQAILAVVFHHKQILLENKKEGTSPTLYIKLA